MNEQRNQNGKNQSRKNRKNKKNQKQTNPNGTNHNTHGSEGPEKDPEQTKQEEQEHLAFVGALAGGLAHEIRNPLSTIKVNLQLLKEDWEEMEGKEEKNSLDRVEKLLTETERLEETLNDFLKFARGFELELQDEDINQVLSDLLEFFNPEAQESGIEIETSFQSGLPLVSIDVSAFRQAILNILRNGLEAMKPDGGSFSVHTFRTENKVGITIKDNGEGIEQERLKKVFEVYYSTKKGGSGLGLPIARRIIQEHDGNISIDSTKGEGTKVHIQLPPAESEEL